MRLPLLLAISLCFTLGLNAQIAPNFTVTDIEGQEHTLYDYLDQGKVVVLDFYAVWCGPCQYNAPGVEALWMERGPDGTDEIMILGLEADDDSSDEETAQYAIDYDCSNPQINNTLDLNDVYGIDYYPTYYVVCPDRTMQEYSGGSPEEIEAALNAGIDQCAPYLDLALDARIYAYNSSTTVCSESTVPNVQIMNMGQETLTSLTIEVFLDGDLESTSNWTGSLSLFESEDVALPIVMLGTSSDPEIVVTISNPNGGQDLNASNDMATVDITAGGTTYETQTLHFELAFDNFPQETTWQFANSQGEIVASGGSYVGFPDFSPPIDSILQIPLEECYTFTIFDSASDGICCAYADPGEGFWRISTDDGTLIGEGGTFNSQESLFFGVSETASVAGQELSEAIKLFPNPTEGQFTVDLSSYPNDVQIRVIDVTSKEVASSRVNAHSQTLFTLNSAPGVYIVECSSGTQRWVKRLIVE